MTFALQTGLKRPQWIVWWSVASMLPFLPLLWPLVLHLFADTPDADLIWVPFLAFSWMVYALWTNEKLYQDDRELNFILGFVASAVVIVVMTIGSRIYPLTFWETGIALLVWPIWVLAVSWLTLGVGITQYIWRPVVYLFLTSPILFAGWMPPLHSLLIQLLQFGLQSIQHVVPWISFHGGAGRVAYDGHWLSASLSTACLGSDSLVALLIVVPFLMAFYEGRRWKKWMLLCIGLGLAVVFNLLRIVVLLSLLHFAGEGTVFDDVHAIIGSILFAGLAYLLSLIGNSVGLCVRVRATNGMDRYLKAPARSDVMWVTLFALLVVWFVYSSIWQNPSYLWRPFQFRVSPTVAMPPNIRPYQWVLLGVYDDSATLGQGAHSVAYAYSTPNGLYHRVEVWEGLSAWRMQAYGVGDCLTFHGDKTFAEIPFSLPNSLDGTSYTVEIPPLTMGGRTELYQVVAYTFLGTTNGQTGYYRIEISTPMATGVTTDNPENQRIADTISAVWKGQGGGGVVSNVVGAQISGTKAFVNAFTRELLKVDSAP